MPAPAAPTSFFTGRSLHVQFQDGLDDTHRHHPGPPRGSGASAEPCAQPARHDHAVVAFYEAGSRTLDQGGQWTVRAGDVLLVPPRMPHRWITREPATVWAVGFCTGCALVADLGPLLAPFDRVAEGASCVVSIPVDRRPRLSALFRDLAEVHAHTDEASLLVQKSLLTLLLAEIARAATWKEPAASPDGLVDRALAFIERHALEPISLRDVAAAVHRSPSHVTTALRRATGRTANAWIVQARIGEAQRRLVSTDERVDIVAERVGYPDVTHFIRVFRRLVGSTPAAFRRERRANHPLGEATKVPPATT